MGRGGEYGTLLTAYLRPQRRRVVLMVALLALTIALQALGPQLLRRFIDSLIRGVSESVLAWIGLLFLAVVVGGQVVAALATYVSAAVGWAATNALRADLALHCLRLDLRFHHTRSPGELIERIDGDVSALGNFFSQFVVQILGNGLLAIAILALIAAEDWRAGLALTGYVVAALALLLRVQRVGAARFRESRQQAAALAGLWEEVLTTIEDVKALGAQAYTNRRIAIDLREMLRRGRLQVVLFRTFVGTLAVVFAAGNALAFAIGAYLYSTGELTLGTVYLLMYYTNLLATNLGNISSQVNDFQLATVAIARVNELYHTVSAVRDGATDRHPGPQPAVAFECVTFTYTPGVPVLRGVSFHVPPGQTLGVVGRTGSGKSTIAKLLFRFYDPDDGVITLDNTRLRDLRLATLRGAVGLVTQEVQLFNATVRENLTFFDPAIPEATILATLADLGLTDWLARLPAGLDTRLSGSEGLSAGEAQLLAFARAFLADPGVVILDEASSRLDPATERLVEAATARLLQNRTAIVIAHRLDTLRRADLILVLEHGRVAEYGPREALAGDTASRFHKLLRAGLAEVG
jgi:ABC-type multidrug transport system fused ATPase/permease subunit